MAFSSRMITLAALALALSVCISGCSFAVLAQVLSQETETPVSMSFSYDTEAMPAESHAAAPSSVQPISAMSSAVSSMPTRSDTAIAAAAEPVSPQLSLTMDVIPNAAARQHAQQQQAADLSNNAIESNVEWLSADQRLGESSSLSYSISSPLIKFNRSGADADAVSTNTSSALDGAIFMGDRSNTTRGVWDEKAHSSANRSSTTTAHNSTATSSMRGGGEHGHGKSNSSTRSTSRDADASSDDSSSSSSSDSHKKRSNATMASSSTGGADGQLPLPNRTRGSPSSDDQSPSSDAAHAALSLTWARSTALSWSAIALITALAQ